jgi:stage II sporulation protein GA (sporulation sigma-E factor processing peptidase)
LVVYVDLVFLINLLIDGALLLSTAWLRKLPVRRWRMAAAAIIGAGYVVFMLFPSMSMMFTLVVKIVFSVLMVLTAFGFGRLQSFLGNLGAFYLVNFAVAGGIVGIHYLLLSQSELLNEIWFSRSGGMRVEWTGGLLYVATAIALLLFFYKSVFGSLLTRKKLEGFTAEVTIRIGDTEFRCTGLIDTGNRLYEPLTRTPVMIVEAGLWEDVLPASWMKCIRESEVEKIIVDLDATDGFEWQDRLRLVPYRGVNRNNRFLLAIKPDRVIIHYAEQLVEAKKVLIGMDGGKLCADGTYRAIIHPALVS